MLRQSLVRYYHNPRLSERKIRNLKMAIMCLHVEHLPAWAKYLNFIQEATNSSKHASTPAALFLRRIDYLSTSSVES